MVMSTHTAYITYKVFVTTPNNIINLYGVLLVAWRSKTLSSPGHCIIRVFKLLEIEASRTTCDHLHQDFKLSFSTLIDLWHRNDLKCRLKSTSYYVYAFKRCVCAYITYRWYNIPLFVRLTLRLHVLWYYKHTKLKQNIVATCIIMDKMSFEEYMYVHVWFNKTIYFVIIQSVPTTLELSVPQLFWRQHITP